MYQRNEVLQSVCRTFAQRLSIICDAHVQQGRPGLPFVTCNDAEKAKDRGFLHPANFDEEWNSLRFGGAHTVSHVLLRSSRTCMRSAFGTYIDFCMQHIMDGWRLMQQKYHNCFMSNAEESWPVVPIVIITNGESLDLTEFQEALRNIHGRAYVLVVTLGFGKEHEK